jgi:hypothetical protein
MSATGPGDDLKRYLIVPSSSLSASSPAAFTPGTGTGSRPQETTNKYNIYRFQTKNNKIEVNKPTQPTMFDSAYDENKRSALDGVFDMEDFLKAQVLARETNQIPPSKKVKQNNASNAMNTNATPLTPVAVSARTSKHTILLHEKYQALAIPQPHFVYEGGSETGWTVSVSFPGLKDVDGEDVHELQGLKKQDGEKRYNSKQEAKEAISERALEVLEVLENEGRIRKAEKARKKSVGGHCAQQQKPQVKEEKEPSENYVGQLLGMFTLLPDHTKLLTYLSEFQRSTASAQPIYTDYQLGTRFACLVTIEGQDAQFGSLESLHSSKKTARQDAAGRAVSHFKSLGKLLPVHTACETPTDNLHQH